MIEVLAPGRMTTAPVIVPETTTIFLASPSTALVRAARVETVTVVPPEPPVVLENRTGQMLAHIFV
jgi:hypothetical protein